MEANKLIQKAEEEKKEEAKKQSIKRSLSQLIEDMDLEEEEDDMGRSPEQLKQDIGVSKDINLIK